MGAHPPARERYRKHSPLLAAFAWLGFRACPLPSWHIVLAVLNIFTKGTAGGPGHAQLLRRADAESISWCHGGR